MVQELFYKNWLNEFDNLIHWSELDQFKKNNVSTHSYKVVLFTRLILEESFRSNSIAISNFKLQCNDHALFHDWDEIFTKRDLCHEFKYNEFNGFDIRKVVDDFVNFTVNKEIGTRSPSAYLINNSILKTNLSEGVEDIVKMADWLELIHHCMFERNLGNKIFGEKLKYCVDGFNGRYKKFCDNKQFIKDYGVSFSYSYLQSIQTFLKVL